MKRIYLMILMSLLLFGCMDDEKSVEDSTDSLEETGSKSVKSNESQLVDDGVEEPDIDTEKASFIDEIRGLGFDVKPVDANTRLVLFQGRANIKINFNEDDSFNYNGLDYIRLSSLKDEYINPVDGYEYPVVDMLGVILYCDETINLDYQGTLMKTDLKVLEIQGEVFIPLSQVLQPFFEQGETSGDGKQIVLYFERPTGDLYYSLNSNGGDESGYGEIIDLEDEIEIHIIASKEDMKNGFFFVEIWEFGEEDVVRSWRIGMEVSSEDAAEMYKPYMRLGEGEILIDQENLLLDVEASPDNGLIKYGFRVEPKEEMIHYGLVRENLGILNMRNCLVSRTFMNDLLMEEVDIVFDIPSEYELLVPWEVVDDTERRYSIKFNKFQNEIYKAGVAVWGEFQDVSLLEKGDVDLVVFDYDLTPSCDYELYRQTVSDAFDIFMEAFDGVENDFFPPRIIAGFVSEEVLSTTKHSYNLEGYRGAMILEVDEMEGYFVAAQANLGHLLTHWSIDDGLFGRMGIEGMADFGAHYLNYYDDAINQLYELDMKERVRVYNEVVLKNGVDLPIGLKLDGDTLSKIESHNLLEGENLSALIENPDFREYAYIGDEYFISEEYKSQNQFKMVYNDAYQEIDEHWFLYTKSHLVFYILNDYLEKSSNGDVNIYDVLREYNEDILELDYSQWNDQFEKVYSEISGKDISGFSEKYIYGVDPLPIQLIDDVIVVGDF